MNKERLTFITVICFLFVSDLLAQAYFSSSLHATRIGKETWYNAENGGFEALTNVPIEDLGCTSCHGATDADGNAYPENYSPGCTDCHPSNSAYSPDSLSVTQCYSCHGRQATEKVKLGYSDFHRDTLGFKCWDCHTEQDMHGGQRQVLSMLDPGGIEVDCIDCHSTLPEGHASNDPHDGKIHCTSCHAQTVISCYNCHFESQVEAHVKRAKQPIHDFVILVNREKDNKVYPASFQSLSYQGNTWIAMGPFTSHSITGAGRACVDCHVNMGGTNDAILEYNSTGKIQFARWNESDSTLTWKHGVVPLPEDYRSSFKIDFITYNGNAHDPAVPSKNWSFVKGDWDGFQLLYATPLSKAQMAKLGFDTTLTSIKSPIKLNGIPEKFELNQNYPNPFNPTTVISYAIPEDSYVQLKVFDALGKLTATIVDKKQSAGIYSVEFDANGLSSGIYLYTLQSDNFRITKKMILLR